ncbi:thioesterase family protein [Reinekea sp. G2M2-21]|uniref:thioesterase family protein n=1 Tax=Reinekea sp. G2M2-21 TaxID=2788942 RepID=UPI0018A8994A|nr:thioesterase family protein [Reinekea sp. G2M2-21]
MNLFGRFLLFLITLPFIRREFAPFKPIRLTFRVWLHDIDVNIHLTAARYFSFGDFGRLRWLANNKLLSRFVMTGYRAVLNAQEITYIREFRPFSKVELEIELKCWDEKYAYFEQRFYCRGKLFAVAHARMAIVYQSSVISMKEAFSRFGYQVESPPETEAIADWKATLRAKREHFSS